jgi:hypothetical protein
VLKNKTCVGWGGGGGGGGGGDIGQCRGSYYCRDMEVVWETGGVVWGTGGLRRVH